jgi:1,5-anhydro-D-fructose reductase (1,5-anhydro-D-mannitol-forming)
MRCGIIGYGKMGKIREAAIKKAGSEVSLIYEPSVGGYAGTSLMTKYVKNYEEILQSDEIDAVFVCTPNNMNSHFVMKSLVAEKHVFCEKPPAHKAIELIEIKDFLKEDLKVMYGFNHRQHNSIIKAKELIETNEFGNIIWMRGRYGKSVDKNYFTEWRSNFEVAGGGILIDQGIHMLDLFLNFANNFDEMNGFISNNFWKRAGIEDNVFANFRNSETGVTASLHSTMTQWRHLFSLEIFLERGYIVINGLKTPSGTYGEETLTVAKSRTVAPAASWGSEEHFSFPVDNSWDREVLHFFDCIKHKKPIEYGTLDEAIKLMKIIDKIYYFKGEKGDNYQF